MNFHRKAYSAGRTFGRSTGDCTTGAPSAASKEARSGRRSGPVISFMLSVRHRLRTSRGAGVERPVSTRTASRAALPFCLRRLPLLLRDLLAVDLHPGHRLVARAARRAAGTPGFGLPVRYHEETHGAFLHQAGDLLGAKDRVVAFEAGEVDHFLVGVQDNRGRAHSAVGSD